MFRGTIAIFLLVIPFNCMSSVESELTLFELLGGNLGCNLIACMLGALLGSVANICLRIQNGTLQVSEHPFTTIFINIFLNMFIAFIIFLLLNSELQIKIFSTQFDPLSQFIIVILTAFLGDKINDYLFDFIKEKILDRIIGIKNKNEDE